jgi:hypothetical protein
MESGWAAGLFGYLNAYRADAQKGFLRDRISKLLLVIGLEDEAMAFAKTPSLKLLLLAGNFEEAILFAQANADQEGTDEWDQGLGGAFAGGGNFVDALPWLRHNWELGGHEVGGPLGISVVEATALIQAIRASGSDAEVSPILDAMKFEVQRLGSAGLIGSGPYDSADFYAALVSLQSGEHQQGIAFLEAAVDRGGYIQLNWEFLRFMYDDPAIAPILARQQANLTREREKVLSLVCTDNSYADVWVPLESTCSHWDAAQ